MKDKLTFDTFLRCATILVFVIIFGIIFHVRLRGLIPYLIDEYEEHINEPQYTIKENIPLSLTISGKDKQ